MEDNPKSILKKRFKFKIKLRNDGSIFKIHHTIKTENKEIKRIKITKVSINDFNNILAAVDGRGNGIVFELESMEYFILQATIPECSILRFVSNSKTMIIAGTIKGQIILIDISESDTDHKTIRLFSSSITNISYSDPNLLLVSTSTEATILDGNTFEQKHKLITDCGLIKQIGFIPKSDQIYGCFSDDRIHIWTNSSFKLLKNIYPFRLRENKLKTLAATTVNLIIDSNFEIDSYVKSITRDHSQGLIIHLAFSENGQLMCISTWDEFLMIFSTSAWEIVTIIKTPNVTVNYFEFFMHHEMGHMNYLTIITSSNNAVILNLDNLIERIIVCQKNVKKLSVSKNSNLLALILKSGEAQIFCLNYILDQLTMDQLVLKEITKEKSSKIEGCLMEFDKKVPKSITKSRMLPVLKEYGVYPSKYRHLIWQSLLELPKNFESFKELLNRDFHPCVYNYDQIYPLKDLSLLRNFKIHISCLAHWCIAFGECQFLPNFIFPFVKLFENNLLLCFEIIATILINQCQLWFEFSPLEPINYLGMIENILAHFEPELIEFYHRKKITSQIYAWSLAQNAFTEVLDINQWLQLWDNVISYSSYFFVFCIASYSTTLKQIIMKIEVTSDIERLFTEQNHIDIRKVINNAHDLMEKCPKHLHPKNYMVDFEPLHKDFYQKFTKYPKLLAKTQSMISAPLEQQHKILNQKLFELEKAESILTECQNQQLVEKEHAKRLEEVEKKFQDALIKEQQQIAYRRKQLLLYKKYLRNRNMKLLKDAKKDDFEENINKKQKELELLLIDLETKKRTYENDLLFAEEDLKLEELNLLSRKKNSSAKSKHKESLSKNLKKEYEELERELKLFNSECKIVGSS